jgi:beta-lactamase class A
MTAAILDRIEELSLSFSGELAVAATNLATGEQILVRADTVYATASTIKVPILVEVHRQEREGALALDERLELRAEERVGGSGILKELGGGLNPTIEDVATLMIVLSDNTATNMLIDRVGGVEAVNRTMHSLGLESVVLHNRIDFDVIAPDIRLFAESSARDLARLVELLALGEVVDADASAAMLGIMRRQQYLDQVPRYLDFNPYARELGVESPVEIACKTGFFTGTRVDMGAVFLPAGVTFSYCVTSQGGADASFAPENEGAVVNGLVGRLLVAYWWPRSHGEAPLLATQYAARA